MVYRAKKERKAVLAKLVSWEQGVLTESTGTKYEEKKHICIVTAWSKLFLYEKGDIGDPGLPGPPGNKGEKVDN